ncbi:hypothetical protein D3C80_1200700 [compost metagenome]
MAVNKNFAASQIIKARNQIDDGCFTCTRRAYQGDAFSCFHLEGEVLQNIYAWIISKGHVVEGYVTLNGWQRFCIRSIAYGNWLIQRFKDPLKVGDTVDKAIVKVREIQNRLPEKPSIATHRKDDAKGCVSRFEREQSN